MVWEFDDVKTEQKRRLHAEMLRWMVWCMGKEKIRGGFVFCSWMSETKRVGEGTNVRLIITVLVLVIVAVVTRVFKQKSRQSVFTAENQDSPSSSEQYSDAATVPDLWPAPCSLSPRACIKKSSSSSSESSSSSLWYTVGFGSGTVYT